MATTQTVMEISSRSRYSVVTEHGGMPRLTEVTGIFKQTGRKEDSLSGRVIEIDWTVSKRGRL